MLSKFIEQGHKCPQCDTELHLYMRWIKSILFKGVKIGDNSYRFDVTIAPKSHEHFKGESMFLTLDGDSIITEFTSNELKNEAKKWQIYFFMICNPKGIKETDYEEYKISLYSGCYHKSTRFFEFKRDDKDENKEWSLLPTTEEDKEPLYHEDWGFHISEPDLEKVYLLSLNYSKNETEIWHYTVTSEQAKTKGWKPKMFNKKLPLLKTRPDMKRESWDKMAARFDSWIIMS